MVNPTHLNCALIITILITHAYWLHLPHTVLSTYSPDPIQSYNSVRQVLSSLFNRWGNWGIKWLGNMFKTKELDGGTIIEIIQGHWDMKTPCPLGHARTLPHLREECRSLRVEAWFPGLGAPGQDHWCEKPDAFLCSPALFDAVRPRQLSHLREDKLSDISGEWRKYYWRPSESMLNAEQNSSHHWDQTVQVGGRERELCKPGASSRGSWDWFYMIDDLRTECQVINCLSSCHRRHQDHFSLVPGLKDFSSVCLFVWPGAGACQAQLVTLPRPSEKRQEGRWQHLARGHRTWRRSSRIGSRGKRYVCVRAHVIEKERDGNSPTLGILNSSSTCAVGSIWPTVIFSLWLSFFI